MNPAPAPSAAAGPSARFGEFGGRFAPETLMAPLLELEEAWLHFREDPAFLAELAELNRDYAGRPTPLTLARRLSGRLQCEIWLKREDLLHTGA
ncbi:MAG: tryptophan synthase subunit beta, partial [Planctomycetota bacterium]